MSEVGNRRAANLGVVSAVAEKAFAPVTPEDVDATVPGFLRKPAGAGGSAEAVRAEAEPLNYAPDHPFLRAGISLAIKGAESGCAKPAT